MTVESHNEYQSNIVMNRNPLMAVKGRQAKLKDPHDTTRIYQFCTVKFFWAHQMKKYQKDVNVVTDDVSGVTSIWCVGEGT